MKKNNRNLKSTFNLAKICFIISTIGDENSPEREQANEKYDYLFKPALLELDYELIRADKEDIPGSISRQIVERIIKSELVIADISDYNPNVFYELSIRNAVNKPVIVIKTPEQKPPFDIQDTRAISVDMMKPKIWQSAITQIKKQVKEAEKNPTQASQSILSDFTFQIDVQKEEDIDFEILRRIKDLESSVRQTRQNVPRPKEVFWNSISYIPLKSKKKLTGIDYKYVGNCKSCNQPILTTIPWDSDPDEDFKASLSCPYCKKTYEYTMKDLTRTL